MPFSVRSCYMMYFSIKKQHWWPSWKNIVQLMHVFINKVNQATISSQHKYPVVQCLHFSTRKSISSTHKFSVVQCLHFSTRKSTWRPFPTLIKLSKAYTCPPESQHNFCKIVRGKKKENHTYQMCKHTSIRVACSWKHCSGIVPLRDKRMKGCQRIQRRLQWSLKIVHKNF